MNMEPYYRTIEELKVLGYTPPDAAVHLSRWGCREQAKSLISSSTVDLDWLAERLETGNWPRVTGTGLVNQIQAVGGPVRAALLAHGLRIASGEVSPVHRRVSRSHVRR